MVDSDSILVYCRGVMQSIHRREIEATRKGRVGWEIEVWFAL